MNNDQRSWTERRIPFLLISIFIFSLTLRLASAHWDSLWTDEAMAIDFARASWDGLYQRLLYDASPPGSYLFFKAWLSIFENPIFVRYLSALAGSLTVFAVFLLGRRLFNEKIGLLAAALLAVNPYHFYYSQEIRYQALLTFFLVLQMWAFVRLVDREDLGSTYLYALFTSVSAWIQYFFIFVVAAQICWIVCFKRKKFGLLLKSAYALSISATVFLPLTFILWTQLSAGKPDRTILPFGQTVLQSLLFSVLGGSEFSLPSLPILGGMNADGGGITYLVAGVIIGLPFVLFALVGTLTEMKSSKRPLAGTFLAFGSLLLFLVFAQYLPVFRPKYILPLLPVFLCLCSAGVLSEKIPFSGLRTGFGVPILLGIFMIGLINQHTDPLCRREQWQKTNRQIRHLEKKGDAVLLPNRYQSLGFKFSYDGNLPVYSYANDAPALQIVNEQLLDKRITRLQKSYSRFWVVGHKQNLYDPNGLMENYALKNWVQLKRFVPKYINHEISLVLYAKDEAQARDSYLGSVDFTTDRLLPMQLLGGFLEGTPEGYRWMGKRACVTLANKEYADRVYACLYVHRPFFEHNPKVQLLVNNFPVASETILKSDLHCLEGIVPDMMRNEKMLEVTIQFDSAFLPSLVMGGEERMEKTALVQKIGLTNSSNMLGERCVSQ